jgi:ATP-dependent Zn protease
MVAEEIFFGEASSGVASDLKAATVAACQMIGALGMGSTLISSAALETGGGGNIVAKVLSSDAGHDEVEEVLRQAKAEVRELLERHQSIVEGLRDALLERDELVGAEILEVIASIGAPALGAQV